MHQEFKAAPNGTRSKQASRFLLSSSIALLLAIYLWQAMSRNDLTKSSEAVDLNQPLRIYGSRFDGLEIVRQSPRQVAITDEFRDDVDVAKLSSILEKLEPVSPKKFPSVVMSTHALRLWGSEKTFAEGVCVPKGFHFQMWRFSCPTLLEFLLDHGKFREFYPNADPLLMPSPYGVAVRGKIGNFFDRQINRWPDCEAHVDKLLSVLAEIGISTDKAIHAPGKRGTVRDLIADSLARFTPSQEIEFSAKAYLYYLSPPMVWNNRFGKTIHLTTLLENLCEVEFGKGACVGTHVPQVIALALTIDANEPFLGGSRMYLESYMMRLSKILENCQLESGAWPVNWSGNTNHIALVETEGEIAGQIRVTGHHLEWIALSEQRFRPSRKVIQAAVNYLINTMASLEGDNFYHNYTSLTHAGRALRLLSDAK